MDKKNKTNPGSEELREQFESALIAADVDGHLFVGSDKVNHRKITVDSLMQIIAQHDLQMKKRILAEGPKDHKLADLKLEGKDLDNAYDTGEVVGQVNANKEWREAIERVYTEGL